MEKKDVLSSEVDFRELTFQHLTLCMDKFEKNELLSAAIMAAVFAEALLKDIHMFFELELPKGELNSLIDNYKKQVRSIKNLSVDDKNRLRGIINRCDEIRLKRNRLVHDTGLERTGIDADALDIHKNVMEIINLYLKTDMAIQIRHRQKNNIMPEEEKPIDTKFSVFISTITPHTVEQEVFLNAVCNKLSNMGIKPVRCGLTDFDKKDPMEKVRKAIESCQAVLVIGLERSHAYLFRDKEFSPNEREGIHRKHTSSWLHIESGMAVAQKKKIFVMCHKDIYGDGIFDRGWNSYPVLEFDSPLDVKHVKVQETLNAIKEYAEEYLA